MYTIGVMARLLNISPQTLRQFEREGLVEPCRTDNNMRLYSQNELVILQRICHLVKSEGVNIAGVRAVLRIERGYAVATATVHAVKRQVGETAAPDAAGGLDEQGEQTAGTGSGEGDDQPRKGQQGPGAGAPLGLLLAAMLPHLGGRWF